MTTGMLWFDNRPKISLEEKIREAARYYCRKYEQIPDLVLVNTLDRHNNPNLTCVEVDGQMIAVRGWQQAAAGHLWIGTEETSS